MAPPTSSGLASLDPTLISELYDTIDHQPPALQARELLIQLYDGAGMRSEAEALARELLKDDPSNAEALRVCRPQLTKRTESTRKPDNTRSRVQGLQPGHSVRDIKPTRPQGKQHYQPTKFDERHFIERYEVLKERSSTLLRDYVQVENLRSGQSATPSSAKEVEVLKQNLQLLSEGRTDLAVGSQLPPSVRALAARLESVKELGLDFLIEDFSNFIGWWKVSYDDPDTNTVREALLQRMRALQAVLPRARERLATTAMMHADHEILLRTYVNEDTLITMEPVSKISRQAFWATEDGYAWNMDELAQALLANGGVMRNPLSRQMFSSEDVDAIMKHPCCSALIKLIAQQGKLRKGFRSTTTARLAQLADTLLADQSLDQVASRTSIDEFLAYLATLPQAEQDAVDKCRVSAVDSHSRIAFDCTIGEAIRDAQANRVCLHKTGDFLKQAAAHLQHAS